MTERTTSGPAITGSTLRLVLLAGLAILVLGLVRAIALGASPAPAPADEAPAAGVPAAATSPRAEGPAAPSTARLSPGDAAAIAQTALKQMAARAASLGLAPSGGTAPAIQSTKFAVWGELSTLEQRAAGPNSDSPDASRGVWVIRATGVFLGERVPPGAKPIVGTSGYMIIDDQTGTVIGMGTP